jgi:hypothetical protein
MNTLREANARPAATTLDDHTLTTVHSDRAPTSIVEPPAPVTELPPTPEPPAPARVDTAPAHTRPL